MKCWYCEGETMVEAPDLGKGWFKCSNCGGTWIRVPELGSPAATVESGGSDGRSKRKPHPVSRKRKAKK